MRKYYTNVLNTYREAHSLSHNFLQIGLSVASMLLITGLLLFVQNLSDPIFIGSVVKSVFETAYSVSFVAFLFFYLSDYILKKEAK
jgi:hypothetical protein